jgi:hypothetical protein
VVQFWGNLLHVPQSNAETFWSLCPPSTDDEAEAAAEEDELPLGCI